MNKKTKIILRRWRNTFAYIFLWSLIYSTCSAFISYIDNNYNGYLNNYNFCKDLISQFFNDHYFIISLFIITTFIFYYLKTRKTGKNSFNVILNSLKYPPTPLIFIMTIAVFFVMNNPETKIITIVGLFGIILLLTLPLLSKKENNKKEITKNKNTKQKNKKEKTGNDIIEWINSDEHSEKDFFNTEERFKYQITNALETGKNILLIGAFGIGKTWILKKIENEYKKEKTPYIFCFVDSWGRDVKTLSEQILSKIVYEISEYVDITHLGCLPEKYADALERTSSILASILRLGSLAYDAEKVIEKLDNTLSVIDKKVIVVIEDLDRINNKDPEWSYIEPLLDRLKNTENINYIVSIRNSEELDAPKLFQNITLMALDQEKALDTLRKFRNKMIVSYKDDNLVDSYRKEERENQNNSVSTSVKLYNKYLHFESIDIASASLDKEYFYLSFFANTPRKLKIVLKDIYDYWKKLKGEVELDHLIFILAIKNIYPDIFNNIIKNINYYEGFAKNSQLVIHKDNIDYKKDTYQEKDYAMLLASALTNDSKKVKQPFSNNRYIEKLITLKTDYYSDQQILKLGEDYFEKTMVTAEDVVKTIDENNLYKRLFPLWEKYIYRIYLSVKMSDEIAHKVNIVIKNMESKIPSLLFKLIKYIFKEDKKEEIKIKTCYEILNNFAVPEDTVKDLNHRLFEKIYYKNSLEKITNIYDYFNEINEFKYSDFLELFKKESTKNNQFVKKLLENNSFKSIYKLIFSLQKRTIENAENSIKISVEIKSLISFDRKNIEWFLDTVFDLANNEKNENAILIIIYFIILNLSHSSFNGKIFITNPKSDYSLKLEEIFEELIKILYPKNNKQIPDLIYDYLNEEYIQKLYVNLYPYYNSIIDKNDDKEGMIMGTATIIKNHIENKKNNSTLHYPL